MIHVLRIVVCILCVSGCAKLMVTWVRSYETAEQWPSSIAGRVNVLVVTNQGRLAILFLRPHGAPGWWQKQHRRLPVDDELSFSLGGRKSRTEAMGFGWIRDPLYWVMRPVQEWPDGTTVHYMGAASASLRGGGPVVPYWFLVLLTASMAAAVFMKWPPRFSLRGLLIAVTIVAVALTLETWLGH